VYISLHNFVLCNLAVYFILLLKNKLDYIINTTETDFRK